MASSLSGNGFANNIRGIRQPRERYKAVAGNRLNNFPVDNKIGDDIDVNELVGAHNKRKQQRTQICEMVYRKCCNRIRYAKEVQYVKECYFKVPEVQLWGGVPSYNLNQVVGYIMIRLKDKGFDVKFIPPDGVLINWGRIVNRNAKPTTVIQSNSFFEEGLPAVEAPEKVIRYELDEIDTRPRKPRGEDATPVDRLIHKGCTGDCCTRDPVRRDRAERVTRHAREEMSRRRQQDDIEALIAERDRSDGRR